MDYTRDLSSAELWAQSLERSLGRRGRPRRASLELGRLTPERDLAEDGALSDSTLYWRHRRAASASSSFPVPAAGGASMLALLAATTLPSLTGASVTRGKRGGLHAASRSGVGASIAAVHRRALVIRSTRPAPASAPAPFVKLVSAAVSAPAARAAATPAAAAKAPASYGTVTHGDVIGVQKMLGLAPDGVLGPHTGAAIRAFQAAHGLTVDGNVGFATWTAMKAVHTSAAPAPAAHLIASTSATPAKAPAAGDVHALQARLGLQADGSYGSATKHAVEAFQAAHGLTVDGVVGSATRSALGLGNGPTIEPTSSSAGSDAAATQSTQAATASTVATATSSSTAAGTAATQTSSTTATSSATTATGEGVGSAVSSTQLAISEMIAAGDQIATLPYIWGGGHGSWVAAGYDCSGSVSYVLHAAGLLSVPEDSGTLESYGAPGPGRYVTIYANATHAWMTIDGRRFDTVSLAQNGSRWGTTPGDPTGFVVRHPIGF